jgi:hypothetical protein
MPVVVLVVHLHHTHLMLVVLLMVVDCRAHQALVLLVKITLVVVGVEHQQQ